MRGALILGTIGLALWGHVVVSAQPERAGLALVADHVLVVVAVLLLLGLCAALGLMALRQLRLEMEPLVERLIFALPVGAGFLGTGLLLASSALGVNRPVLLAVLLGACAIAKHQLRILPSLVARAGGELRQMAGPRWLVLIGVMALGLTVRALAPPFEYDSLMYHIRVPAQFLERGAVFVPDDNLHVAVVGLAHFLYLPLLAAEMPAGPAIFNVAFAILLCLGLLTAGTQCFSRSTGRLASALLWGSPIVILVSVTPKVDVTVACYVLLGQHALVRALRERSNSREWLTVAGLILAFACAIKYLALAYGLALAPLLLAIFHGRTAREAAPLLVRFGTVAVLSVLPWFLKNLILLGSLFYPDSSLPPWLAAIHGSDSVPASLDRSALTPLAAIRQPFEISSWFLAPERLTPEGEGWAYRANPAFLALPFAVLGARRRTTLAFVFPALLYICLVIAYSAETNLRYLIPALPALTIGAAAALETCVDRALNSLRLLAGIVLAASLAPALVVLGATLWGTGAIPHAIGLVSRDDYWHSTTRPALAGYSRRTALVKQHVPDDGRVLLLFDGRGYGYSSDVLQDNVLTNWPLLISIIGDKGCLETTRITHVLVNETLLAYFTERGMDSRAVLWHKFPEFAERCLKHVTDQDGSVLYSVRASSGHGEDEQ